MTQENQTKKKTAVAYFRTAYCEEADERSSWIAKQRKRVHTAKDVKIVQEFADYGNIGEISLFRVSLFFRGKRPTFRKMLAYLKKNPTDYVLVSTPDRLSRHRDEYKKLVRKIEKRGSKVKFISDF